MDLTNRLTGLLDSRKYLEDNEITLMISLLEIYSSAVVQQRPKQTHREDVANLILECSHLNLKYEQALSSAKES